MATLCGVPERECTGGTHTMADVIGRVTTKAHGSSTEAFECYRRYLLKRGYEQVGNRDFLAPDGVVLVLTKKIRFGGRLRKGKGGRLMPKRHISGLIF